MANLIALALAILKKLLELWAAKKNEKANTDIDNDPTGEWLRRMGGTDTRTKSPEDTECNSDKQ